MRGTGGGKIDSKHGQRLRETSFFRWSWKLYFIHNAAGKNAEASFVFSFKDHSNDGSTWSCRTVVAMWEFCVFLYLGKFSIWPIWVEWEWDLQAYIKTRFFKHTFSPPLETSGLCAPRRRESQNPGPHSTVEAFGGCKRFYTQRLHMR